ncbi:MAG: hypothetical protein NTW28_03855 [Candidatus Solibacter sp.]|nr:hypothetical protein [Candidatus Solibacter sp.]
MMRKLLYGFLFAAVAASAQVSGPIVTNASVMAVSPTLEDIGRLGQTNLFQTDGGYVERNHYRPKVVVPPSGLSAVPLAPAPLVSVAADTPYNQTANFQPLGVTISTNFEALGVGTPGYSVTGAPPDTTMGVSPTQIVQWVNSHIAVYDKAGTPLLAAPGFIAGNVIWSALPAGSLCRSFNRGDPLVQYDRIAGRWILSQFAFNGTFAQNAQCFAVSTTSSALGSYNLYEFSFGGVLPDYGKLGVWPDAYYMSYNMFTTGSTFSDGRACAYDRTAMLAGGPATSVCFESPDDFSFLPADFDGTNLPPAGSPNYYISWNYYNVFAPYTMQLRKFVANFATPANSSFTDGFGGGNLSFVGFNMDAATKAACNDGATNLTCVPQLGTTQRLDTLADRQMYRLVYRNFGTHEALLFTQSVDTNETSVLQAQLRWWEIRNPGANPPVVFQNSTYKPDATFRWMSSAAFDRLGNIGIGFSASSSTMNPAIRIAGRRRTDPVNLLRTEQLVQAGAGSQGLSLNRWGDYSTMQVDPQDDCKLWYTTQYIGANGTFNWRTKIAGFKFPNCVP